GVRREGPVRSSPGPSRPVSRPDRRGESRGCPAGAPLPQSRPPGPVSRSAPESGCWLSGLLPHLQTRSPPLPPPFSAFLRAWDLPDPLDVQLASRTIIENGLLPHVWNKAVLYSPHVCSVTRKVPRKDFLLVG